MRLDDQPESENIEDRRGYGSGFGGLGGGGGGLRIGGVGGLGLVAILVVGWLLGINPAALLDMVENGGPAPTQQSQTGAPQGNPAQPGQEDAQRRFVARVLGSTEQVWSEVFQQYGRRYAPPTLVLFSGTTQSGCGTAQTATGPFYCPADQKVYLDTSFFRAMQDRLNAPGDFPRAYVIAHEVGHHVQNLLGTADMRAGRSNEESVRTELQADCFAGVWAKRADATGHLLEQGDVEEGLNAAAAIGDDRLQMRARGYVVPDSFTHGSSAQRVRWFTRGLQSGDIRNCDTFHADRL